MTLVAPEKDEPESFHVDHAWRLRLSGPGAAQVNPLRLGTLLLDRGIVPSKKAWDESTFYQLGNPLERFVAFSEAHRPNIKFEHGRAFDLPFDPNNPQRLGRMQVEEVGRKELSCTISFVVPSATGEWVGTLLSRAGIPPHRIEKVAVPR